MSPGLGRPGQVFADCAHMPSARLRSRHGWHWPFHSIWRLWAREGTAGSGNKLPPGKEDRHHPARLAWSWARMAGGSCLAPSGPLAPSSLTCMSQAPAGCRASGLQWKTSGECHSFGAFLVAEHGGRGSEIRRPSLSWMKYLPPGQGCSMDQLWLQPPHTRFMLN